MNNCMSDKTLADIKDYANELIRGPHYNFRGYDGNLRRFAQQVQTLLAENRHLRERLEVTDEKVERAALDLIGINEWPSDDELDRDPDNAGMGAAQFRDAFMDEARHALAVFIEGDE